MGKKSNQGYSPQELFNLLNEGLILCVDLDEPWFTEEIPERVIEVVEIDDVDTDLDTGKFIELNTVEHLKPVNLVKLKKVGLQKLRVVNLNKLTKINLRRLKVVNLDRLAKVNLDKLKAVNLDKLTKVNLEKPVKLRSVSLNKLKKVDLHKSLKAVNLTKLTPISLNKLSVINIMKDFDDLQSLNRSSNDLLDLNTEVSTEINEEKEIEVTQSETDKSIDATNSAIEADLSTENDESCSESSYDESSTSDIKVEKSSGYQIIENFDDTSYAENKGALVFEMDDSDDGDDEIDLLREAQILKQREEERREKEKQDKEQQIKSVKAAKKSNKVIIGVILILIALLIGCSILVILWNNEGGDINVILTQVQDTSEQGTEEQEVISEVTGEKETLQFLKVDFTESIKRNNNVVAWLKSDALNLDYPIVKYSDNDFYLNHDLDKKENSAGWLFIDCENRVNPMDFNTLIYGHNRRDRAVFGNLKALLEEGTQNKEGIQYIQFTTLEYSMVFEICSVYTIEYTDTVAYTCDTNDFNLKSEFVQALKTRNVVPKFENDTLSTDDTFLTFSTCYGASGTTKRLIVHCKLRGKIPNR